MHAPRLPLSGDRPTDRRTDGGRTDGHRLQGLPIWVVTSIKESTDLRVDFDAMVVDKLRACDIEHAGRATCARRLLVSGPVLTVPFLPSLLSSPFFSRPPPRHSLTLPFLPSLARSFSRSILRYDERCFRTRSHPCKQAGPQCWLATESAKRVRPELRSCMSAIL